MKIGFIGAGNMASAIMGGLISNNYVNASDICTSDKSEAALEMAKNNLGVNTFSDNKEVAKSVDVLFLCVKPFFAEDVITEIREVVKKETIIVSIIAGKSLDFLKSTFKNEELKIVRTMPNTPALVGEAMVAICPNVTLSEEEKDMVVKMFECLGKGKIVTENLMDAVTSVSGSSPAYVFMFIEAMADEAVKLGMARNDAYVFAAQAVYGSAKLVLETGKHPGELKDMVCSPKGTTIAAVKVLEEKGFRGAVMDAMEACAEVSKNM